MLHHGTNCLGPRAEMCFTVRHDRSSLRYNFAWLLTIGFHSHKQEHRNKSKGIDQDCLCYMLNTIDINHLISVSFSLKGPESLLCNADLIFQFLLVSVYVLYVNRLRSWAQTLHLTPKLNLQRKVSVSASLYCMYCMFLVQFPDAQH